MLYSRRSARLFASIAAFVACPSWSDSAVAAPQARQAPAAAQARCPAPSSWAAPALPRRYVVNLIQIDKAGTLSWNGSRIEELILSQYMMLIAAMTPRPQTHLEVDPAAPCATVARIVAMMAHAVDCRRGCRYRVTPWHKATPVSPPAPPAPPARFRPVTVSSSPFHPVPAPSAPPPVFRPVPTMPSAPDKESESASPRQL